MAKRITITADIFNDKKLTALMDFAERINPVKPKQEQEIRTAYREKIQRRDLGTPVKRSGERFNRKSIMLGTTLFGGTPEVREDDISLIADAGFDFILSTNCGEYARRVLDWCEKYNISVIGNEFREFAEGNHQKMCVENPEKVRDFIPHPASVGDDGIDEPFFENIPMLTPLHETYNKYFPDRFLFSNLLPGLELRNVLGVHSYRRYVERFSKCVDTDYICADIYPFHPSRLVNIFEMIICLNTYHTLADVCRRDSKDFWIYIQSQGKWFSHLYTMTTREMIKWQVYTTLAYGCRSILHVSYNPVWGNDAVGMIDYDGNLTEQYLYVKEINNDARKLIDVMKDYRGLGVTFSDAVKDNPHFAAARIKQAINNNRQGFFGIPPVDDISSESTVITGYFRNSEGKYALMPVNCRNLYDPDAVQTVSIKLNRPMKVRTFNRGEMSGETVTDTVILEIASCEGAFITLEDAD